ncbi:MAG: radical SAM protein, partial [Firmicutes bacterium]|nr:radical SAM protein [Bacillota bacterium]
MENKRYITREGGATVTVFVPYDCKNNCPFCINKQEYKDQSGFSIEKICKSIRKLHRVTPKCDFVFTGGEPLSDLDGLQKMMDCVPKGHRVFINTTMPVSEHFPEEAIIEFTKRNQKKITCINVSRHMVHYVEESNDELLSKL